MCMWHVDTPLHTQPWIASAGKAVTVTYNTDLALEGGGGDQTGNLTGTPIPVGSSVFAFLLQLALEFFEWVIKAQRPG
jgi:hypothetical protein